MIIVCAPLVPARHLCADHLGRQSAQSDKCRLWRGYVPLGCATRNKEVTCGGNGNGGGDKDGSVGTHIWHQRSLGDMVVDAELTKVTEST